MQFDIVLPSIISIVTVAIVLLYARFEARIKPFFKGKEFGIRDAVFLVVAMGIMVTIIVFVPQQAIKVLFLMAYSFVLFLFTYVALERWYFAVLPSMVFLGMYFSPFWRAPFWGLVLLDVFGIVFAVAISLYLGGLFSWATVLVFAALITVMDSIQVLVTGFMGASVEKLGAERLPVFIEVPAFPFQGSILLGLGDIFLAGLLAIQTGQRFSRKAGVICAVSIGFAFLLFEIAILNYKFTHYFPATLVVVCGWLLGLGLYRLAGRKWA